MPVMVVTFGTHEDITSPSCDGKVLRFPVTVIDRDDVGTPRQPSKTKRFRICVEVSDSLISPRGLAQGDLIKVLFEIARKHLTNTLGLGKRMDGDLSVTVDKVTFDDACSLDLTLIKDPDGAVFEIEIKRPIGFS